MEGTLDSTRREWEEGNRRLQAAASPTARSYERLLAEVDLVLERAAPAGRADVHARASSPPPTASPSAGSQAAMIEAEPAPGWPARSTTVQDAAFHLYSRGAIDYKP